MIHNPVIDSLMQRKSIRSYKPDQPSQEVVETIVSAGQSAPFAYQLGSVLLSRHAEKNPWHAPLNFTICVDLHRFEPQHCGAVVRAGLGPGAYSRHIPDGVPGRAGPGQRCHLCP